MKGFLTAAERLGSFEEIRRNLAEGVTPMLATGLSQIHKVHFAWALTGGSRLVLTPDEPAAVRMAEDLNRFYGEEKAVVFPTREFSFREVEGVSREYEFARLRVLESLDAAGCTTWQKIRYGILPQLTADFTSTIIYRFDMNLRDATVLGLVGAGGIGAPLIFAMSSYRWNEVGAILLGLIVLVLIIEWISAKIRTKLARG